MPRKKISLVLEVALSDRESFPNLPTKKQQKNIYDRVRNKLIRSGVSGDLLKNQLVAEIRSELFKIQEPHKTKDSEKIKEDNEADFFRRDRFEKPIRGYDLWGEHKEEIDPIDQLERNYNETVAKGFRDTFCPVCKCEPCCCRDD